MVTVNLVIFGQGAMKSVGVLRSLETIGAETFRGILESFRKKAEEMMEMRRERRFIVKVILSFRLNVRSSRENLIDVRMSCILQGFRS